MKNKLAWFNLLGVLALTFLCIIQWRHDRALNLELNRSEKARMDQAAKLAEQAHNLDGANQDLAAIKGSVVQKQDALARSERDLKNSTYSNLTLAAQCAELKAEITNWSSTVAVQNSSIKEANARIEQLAADLNASILKFNQLTTNYNDVVKQLNTLNATNRAQANR